MKNNFTMPMLTEMRLIVEKEHQQRISSTYGKLSSNVDPKALKEGIKEDEKNPFTPIGKTAALLTRIQDQMDEYKDGLTKKSK